MDMEVKKRKIQSNRTVQAIETPRHTVFLDMDNDCIEAICNWLPVVDLCSFSLTCKRYYTLANQYFYRRYPDHRMELANETSGPQIKKTTERYAQCFQSNIRNIRLTSMYWNLKPIRLFTFLRMNCCENLNELEFDTINLESKQPYGEQILSQLANLATISFINCTVYDIYNSLLRYCKRIKHIVVKEEKPVRLNCAWMLHEYPNLESIIYYASEFFNIPPFIEFFQLNPQIKNVACSGNRMFNVIINESITLDYLVLRIEHASFFTRYFPHLKLLCEERRVKRLKLDFGWYVIFTPEITNNLATLGAFTALDGLSFATKDLQLISYQPIIKRHFNHVTWLSLEVAQPITDDIFQVLTFTVPNLQEIHLHPWWNEFIVSFRACIGILASKLKQLKTIAIYQIEAGIISENAIAQMDILRRQLSDACPLSIYLPYEIIQNIKFIIPVGSLVTVKPISSLHRDIYSSERRPI